MHRRARLRPVAVPVAMLACGSLALGACLLPSYTLDTSSTGDTGPGGGGTGGTPTTTGTGGTGEGGGGSTATTTDTTGGGGTGGSTTSTTTTTTSTTTTEPTCRDCPDWALSFGSSLVDNLRALAVSPAGQIVVGGTHQGPFQFPSGVTVSHGGATDGFIGLFSGAGAGGVVLGLRGDNPTPNDQIVTDVIFDSAGVVVAGHFTGSLMLSATVTMVSHGGTDAFVARYDTAGTLLWSRHLFGPGNEKALAIAFDPSGNVVVGGTYTGTPTFDAAPLPGHGPGTADCFLLKLDAAGAVIPASTWPIRSWGTTDDDILADLAVDAAGRIAVVGEHKKAIGFDDSQIPALQNSSMNADGYLLRFDDSGAYKPPLSFSGVGEQHVYGVATHGDGEILVAGTFAGTMSVGAMQVQNLDATPDVFVAKLQASGAVTWVTPIPNVNVVAPLALAATAGGPVLAGGFSGTADLLSGTSITAAGLDPFVVQLDANGGYVGHRVWSAPGTQVATALAVDGTGALVLGGQISEPIDFGAGGLLPVTGAPDVFLLRMPSLAP